MSLQMSEFKQKISFSNSINIMTADVIFSTELQATTIRCHWLVIFPIIIHIQVPQMQKRSQRKSIRLRSEEF